MKTFPQTKTCGDCGQADSRILSVQQAAFEQGREWSAPCTKCGSINFSSLQHPLPDVSRELLEIWIHDADLQFLSQDEDLIIGIAENLTLLEEFLQRRDAVQGKREIILSAICVVLYDNAVGHNPAFLRNPVFVSEAGDILKRNMTIFDELDETCIADHIGKVVSPIIGRTMPRMVPVD